MKSLTLLLTAGFLSLSVYGQWVDDTAVNTLVSENESSDMYSVGTSDGKTYVVYFENAPSPVDFELRLQVLDSLGYKTLGEDGILVSDSINMSTFTLTSFVTVDQNDNLYLGITASQDAVGHIYKMDIDGNHLWPDTAITLPDGYNTRILPMSDGGAIVTWSPGGFGQMQRYDANGEAVWEAPKSVEFGTANTAVGNLFALSDGGFEAIFHSYSFGISSTLYAQRYDGDGVAQWTSPPQLSDKSTAFINNYSALQIDDVVYIGYSASSSNRFDSFLQRINADGTLPWGINGSDFDVSETDFEMNTQIAHSDTSTYIWAICTYTDPTQSDKGEYVQKFDKDSGARMLTDNAKNLFPISSDPSVHNSPLYLVNGKPFFMVASGYDDGASPVHLNVTLLDQNGDFVWTGETKPMATYDANKSRTNMVMPVGGQSVAVFVEDKGEGPRIYAQNFVDDTLLGLIDLNDRKLTLNMYPNPAVEYVNIAFDSPRAVEVTMTVYNAVGKTVYTTGQNAVAGENLLRVALPDLASGTYFCRLTSRGGAFDWSGKFMVTE